jgi:hypothetical protein
MIRVSQTYPPGRLSLAVALAVAGGLAGCASSGSGSGSAVMDGLQTFNETKKEVDRAVRAPFNTKDPVALTAGNGLLGPAAKPFDEAKIKTAVERYAEGRKQKAGSYVAAGANLTPDGKMRVLVLFTSENWCQPQGCDLAIFEQGTFGWKSAGTISRVRAPVLIGTTVTSGWYDVWTSTGRQAKPGKDGKESKDKSFVTNVRLQYGANGYPSTTTFAISGTTGAPEGQAVFQSAELAVPDKARFATANKDPEENKKKKKSGGLFGAPAKPATPTVTPGSTVAPTDPAGAAPK